MLTLYFAPGSSSMAVHIALHEIGVAFDGRPVSFNGRAGLSRELESRVGVAVGKLCRVAVLGVRTLHRHCEKRSDEAIQLCVRSLLDCFASLAMTETPNIAPGSHGLDSPVACKRAVLNKRRNPVLNFVGGEFVTVIAFIGAMFRQHASRP